MRNLTCFKCHNDTAVLTYEENRRYKVSCDCGCAYTFEHSSMKCAEEYHYKMVELHGEIDRNAVLKAENAALRSDKCEKSCDKCTTRQSECLAYRARLAARYEKLALKNAMEADELRAQLELLRKPKQEV